MDSERSGRLLSGEAVTRTVREGLVRECTEAGVTLRLPWFFGDAEDGAERGEDLVITIRRADLPYSSPQPYKQRYGRSCVDTEKYDTYLISDGGRAIAELERRVGDIAPYMPRIKRVLVNTGENTLRGGRIIEKAYSVYSVHQHMRALSYFLDAVTQVANLDILPPYGSDSYSENRDKELAELAEIVNKT